MTQPILVSISEASQALGVSEATLRQWTDEGKIKAFITPGGHRRYSVEDLKHFTASHHKVLGIKDLVAELEDTLRLHREIARKYISATPWHGRLGREEEYLAELGRRLLDLITRYIAEPSRRKDTLPLAREVGNELGKTLIRVGLPLTDSLEGFMLHRDPLMDAATHLLKKREAVDGRLMKIIPLLTHVTDEALIGLVLAYQQHRDEVYDALKGGAS
ncbi:MAG: MerR family transcriptional regulator [Chloroflexi bacterium]|nr:MerR family transcriptional regulator [Chloroflexota bacterium]